MEKKRKGRKKGKEESMRIKIKYWRTAVQDSSPTPTRRIVGTSPFFKASLYSSEDAGNINACDDKTYEQTILNQEIEIQKTRRSKVWTG